MAQVVTQPPPPMIPVQQGAGEQATLVIQLQCFQAPNGKCFVDLICSAEGLHAAPKAAV